MAFPRSCHSGVASRSRYVYIYLDAYSFLGNLGISLMTCKALKRDILSQDKRDILSQDKRDILSQDKRDILSQDKRDILSQDKKRDILSQDKRDILSQD